MQRRGVPKSLFGYNHDEGHWAKQSWLLSISRTASLTPSPPTPKLRSHTNLACSAVTSGSVWCLLSTCSNSKHRTLNTNRLASSSPFYFRTQIFCSTQCIGSRKRLNKFWGNCSTRTRMKSFPSPWYFVNSSMFAMLAMATCLVLRALLASLFTVGEKHRWLGPAEKEWASTARMLRACKSSIARMQARHRPRNVSLSK